MIGCDSVSWRSSGGRAPVRWKAPRLGDRLPSSASRWSIPSTELSSQLLCCTTRGSRTSRRCLRGLQSRLGTDWEDRQHRINAAGYQLAYPPGRTRQLERYAAISLAIGVACSWPASECGYNTLVAPHTARTESYAALVRGRQACHACRGLINPSECEGGIHDSDQIGPWSLWQGNLSADLLVVGQDWGDTRYFAKNKGREKAFRELLSVA